MDDIFYREPRRARRIRDRHRMEAKAAKRLSYKGTWAAPDSIGFRGGNGKLYAASWEEVFARRTAMAARMRDNMAACSCAMCGNPRKWLGEPTMQERRARDVSDED